MKNLEVGDLIQFKKSKIIAIIISERITSAGNRELKTDRADHYVLDRILEKMTIILSKKEDNID